MADEDTLHNLQLQLASLQSRIKDMESENSKLASRLSNCRWPQVEENTHENVGNGVVPMGPSEKLKQEGCKKVRPCTITPKDMLLLNSCILAMEKKAGNKFLGEHDFRNFCKMDAINVHIYKRRVTSFEISLAEIESREHWRIQDSQQAAMARDIQDIRQESREMHGMLQQLFFQHTQRHYDPSLPWPPPPSE